MKNINWKVRARNKRFWLALIPAALLLVQQVVGIFGVEIAIEGLQESILAIVGTVFMLLTILGIVEDQTTEGFKDSKQARQYDKPKEDKYM